MCALLRGVALSLLMMVFATSVAAQRVQLTISGLPLTTPTTSPNDFDAGSVALGSTGFSVEVVNNNNTRRRTTVSVRCALPCPATGSLDLSRVQWRRADLGSWNSLTTSFTAPSVVEFRNIQNGVENDPWSNSIFWRYLLDWVLTPPAAASRFNLEFQLTVAAP